MAARPVGARRRVGEPLVALVGGRQGSARPGWPTSWPGGPSTGTAPPIPVLVGPAAAPDRHFGRPAPSGSPWLGAKADERQVLLGILEHDPGLAAGRPGQLLIGDKNYYGKDFEAALAGEGVNPAAPRKGEPGSAASCSATIPTSSLPVVSGMSASVSCATSGRLCARCSRELQPRRVTCFGPVNGLTVPWPCRTALPQPQSRAADATPAGAADIYRVTGEAAPDGTGTNAAIR